MYGLHGALSYRIATIITTAVENLKSHKTNYVRDTHMQSTLSELTPALHFFLNSRMSYTKMAALRICVPGQKKNPSISNRKKKVQSQTC
jgi:hypothetical protein